MLRTKYLRDALTCMHSSFDQPVPQKQVRFVFSDMMSLLVEFRNNPGLSIVHDGVKVAQAETKASSEERTHALRRIREEMKRKLANVEGSIAAGEEAKLIVREAGEVGQAALGMGKRNKGPGIINERDYTDELRSRCSQC